jgi:membrane-associated phospholipid phosphatase
VGVVDSDRVAEPYSESDRDHERQGDPKLVWTLGAVAPGAQDVKADADTSDRRRARRTRVRLAELGLNALARRLLALQAVILVVTVVLFERLGLSLHWSTHTVAPFVMLALLLGLWLYFYFVPGTPSEDVVAELVFVVWLMVAFTWIGSPTQYAAIALRFPYADRMLASTDAYLGVNVGELARWTGRHPAIARLMNASYFALVPQVTTVLLALTALRQRERLWEYAFHFQICLTLALAALVIWPAVCPPAYYGFQPTISMSRVIAQIVGFHQGTMRTIRTDELEGLVSFPSFHVAGGLLVMWAFRGYRWILAPLLLVNIAMFASTCFTGVHYVTDVIGAVPLVTLSLGAWRWWGRPLLQRHDSLRRDSAARGEPAEISTW